MATKWSPKDPNDTADYWWDWTEFLPEAEAIVDAAVTVPTGLTSLVNDFTDKQVRVRLSGGTLGESYLIDCLITTDAGQIFEQTNTLAVKERIK